jgi:PAS domain S-box-containing protein
MSEKTSSVPDGQAVFPKAQILLVDDRPANLLALQAVLDDLGQELVLAGSGEQALELLPEHDFAVVLLDVQLSGISGLETARRIREHERSRNTPIIFITAYSDDPGFSMRDACSLGAVDYLVKPLVPELLRAKVMALVELFRRHKQVRDLERRYGALVEATSQVVWFWNPSSGAADYGEAQHWWETLTGQTPAEQGVNAAGWLDVVHPDDRARIGAAWGNSLAAGVPYDLEYRARARIGGWCHIHARGVPIPAPGGSVSEWVGMVEDVTDRRRAQEVQHFLAEAGQVLASSLDYEETLAAVAGLVVPRLADWCSVYVTEPDGRLRQLAVAHADPAKVAWARELASRYPPSHDAPRGVAAVVRSGQPELVPEVTGEMVTAAARDETHLAIIRSLGVKSAMTVPLSARGRTLGAITFVAAESGRQYGESDLSLAIDLGRRAGLAVDNARLFRESQEALRLLGLLIEASGRLTSSLDPPSVHAAILDLSHRLVAADAYAIWRFHPDGTSWEVAGSAGLSQEYLQTQGRIQGGTPMLDHPILAEDALASAALESRRQAYAAEGIASVLAVPLRSHGRLSGTLVFYYRTRRRFDDVTVRVATAMADLAGAALATADLYGRERESRQRAEEADRRKSEFMAMLAHELRNPLAPIRTSLHILKTRGGDWSVLEQVRGMMERQVNHLGRLVDDLLDLSRISLGKVRVRNDRLDLAQVVRRTLEAHREAFAGRQVALRLDCPDMPVWVSGDETRLAQILDNLLANALKFTPASGHVKVTVTTNPDGQTTVSVADNGIGISPEMLPHLFEAFSQADHTLDRSQGGLGLGLTIVKGLAELHGGSVRAESAGLGQGSVFTVTLPQAREPPSPTMAPLATQSAAVQLRVLVVEDNRDAADSLCLLLRLVGYDVMVAYSGPEGVRAAEEKRPDVVICDIGLPGMDGYRVAAALRGNPATAAARLIALTGYGQEIDRSRAMEAGFDEHLTKPADPVVVQRILAEVGAARAN